MDKDSIPAGEFKTHCLRLFDEVQDGRSFVVTKHGKPVARVVPATKTKKTKMPKAGFMKGSGRITGDVVSPMHELWDIENWKFPY